MLVFCGNIMICGCNSFVRPENGYTTFLKAIKCLRTGYLVNIMSVNVKNIRTIFGERPGMGQTMKLANNLMSATALAITSEAMVMGVKAGLDPKIMLEVINAGSGRNSASQDKFPRSVLPRTFDFGFTHELLYKDVKLCLDEAEALGVPMWVGNAVCQLLGVAKVRQGPSADITTIVKCVEEWAGVEVKG